MGLRTIFNGGPFWLIVYLGLAFFSINYCYCWAQLMVTRETEIGFDFQLAQSNWRTGLALFIISIVLKAMWFGAWIQMLAHTWIWSRKWKPPTSPSNKTIMQIDPGLLGYGELPFHELLTPRVCPKGCRFEKKGNPEETYSWLSDRAYHCTDLGRCLPVYDHYCKYLRAALYLHTQKAYINLNLWVLLDTLFTFVVSIVALASGHAPSVAPYIATVILAAMVIFAVARETLSDHFWRQTWRNITFAERHIRFKKGNPWCLAFKVRKHGSAGEWILRLRSFDSNPWDLGPRENLRHILGPWWQWPFFWIQPERVSRYGNYAGWDLPFGNEVLKQRDALIGFTGVTIEEPGPSTNQAEVSARRRQNRSSASRRSHARSSGGSATHAESTA
ncbi:hypothetical protein F5Y19DRAFT_471166 [Xylariaceae sp. FL1651]|nr:hypothetical protein F5Y19DRAFT_471166 [Xylariaceae sp. FL1651]